MSFKISRPQFIVFSAFLIAGMFVVALPYFSNPHRINSNNRQPALVPAALAGSKEKFDYLSNQTSSYCSLQPTSIEGYADSDFLQGACCSAMDLHRYQEQVEYLKRYADIPQIPADPYDISTELAKELLAYQEKITLTEEQQATYDQAVELSDEKGPCCCQCWRWHAFEGQAKYLIIELEWSADQVAELWDFEDGCGGPGHGHT